MSPRITWLMQLGKAGPKATTRGLVALRASRQRGGGPGAASPANERSDDPALAVLMEEARRYGADYIFLREATTTEPPIAEALVYVDDTYSDDDFAALHRRLWSWGRVPLVYRKKASSVDLLRCAHRPDFASKGTLRYNAFRTLDLMSELGTHNKLEPWWDDSMLRDGSLWDDPDVCKELLSADKASHRALVQAVADLDSELDHARVLPGRLRRRLLVLSMLIAYLEDRGVLEAEDFARCSPKAQSFFDVLRNATGLCALLSRLQDRFNGDVFALTDEDRETIRETHGLERFATLVQGRTETSGQMTLWRLYSFRDLPVEMISHVYQHFVRNTPSAVYTPPFLVRMMVAEILDWNRLDKMDSCEDVVLDPACGSGVFLVEAYKRLIEHWRSTHGWQRPDAATLRVLMGRIRGVDINPDAIELAAFSLCLAMCDALDLSVLKASTKLFPKLRGTSLYETCFFSAKANNVFGQNIGVVIGNPPFQSTLSTDGAKASYASYCEEFGSLPDKQVAYLFLHESLSVLRPGGVLCLLQQYNLLYNQKAAGFRRQLFERWDVREILDFVSIRGLFEPADTKVLAVVVEAQQPSDRKVLHATFRRTGRVAAQRGFDIDYYDQHWLSRSQVTGNSRVWRSNLVGGGRVVDLVDRLRAVRTLGEYVKERQWDCGEGFITGGSRVNPNRSIKHVVGKRYMPSTALTDNGIDESQISTVEAKSIEEPRSPARFSAPMLLIREHIDLFNEIVPKGYLTYPDQVVGICAPESDLPQLRKVKSWLETEIRPLRAYVAATSPKIQKATVVTDADIRALPYPTSGSLALSANDDILVDDIVDHYRDFMRLGQKSTMLGACPPENLRAFCEVYVRQINVVYSTLRPLEAYTWPGATCQPFVFGDGEVDWTGVEGLRSRLVALLAERRQGLRIHRIARIFDGPFVFLLKPDRLRYWLRSVALRDADDTLADLHGQGL